jgi:glycosyltransferase involved in cell wall biosynthesis
LVHVVVNDGGEVAAVENAFSSSKSVELLHLSHRRGRGAAANAGLAASQSTLVVFHDDDDTWHPQFLRKAVDQWERTQRRGVVARAELVIEDTSLREIRREPFFPELRAISLADVAKENCFVNLAFLAERAAIESVGGYDEQLALYEDWDFNLRFLQKYDVAFIDDVLAFYHLREEATGDEANSFAHEGKTSNDARAVLLNRWMRKNENIGLLMALGPTLDAVHKSRQRIDKLFNLLHGVRQVKAIRAVESWLSRGR